MELRGFWVTMITIEKDSEKEQLTRERDALRAALEKYRGIENRHGEESASLDLDQPMLPMGEEVSK